MKKAVKRRSYHSEKRQQQAGETRQAMIDAARRLFAEVGYQATTIDAIAEEAGVSSPTVYAVFGSKRGLMLAISDDMDVRADFAAVEREVAAARTAHDQLRLLVAGQVNFFSKNADFLQPLREAGRTDESLGLLWTEGHKRHHAAYVRMARQWAEMNALRPGLDQKEAADTMSALTWIDLYWYLTDHCGWSAEQHRDWLIRTLSTLLLTPAR